jgi:hypothetical protein
MSNIVRAEIVPTDLMPRLNPMELVRQMVQREVQKLTADREAFVFEPFFRSKRVTDEIRRLQTMPELHKWSHYYQEFGCIARCGVETRIHTGLGFCEVCHSETYRRLKSVMRKYKTQHDDRFDRDFHDSERTAKLALGSELNALPPMRRR